MDYSHRVAERGLQLDTEFILRGARDHVAAAPEGKRNITLFRECLEMIRCGIDPMLLEISAIDAGLKPEEVVKVIENACARFDPSRSASVLQRVDAWLAWARTKVRPPWFDLLEEIVRMCVEQNTMAPMIVQSRVQSIVGRSGTSRRLTALHDRGVIHRRYMGWQDNKRRRSNVYELCMRLAEPYISDSCCQRAPALRDYLSAAPTVAPQNPSSHDIKGEQS